MFFNHAAGARHHRQRGKAEEIHLEHAHAVEDAHLKLGDGFDGRFFRAGGWPVNGQILGNRLVRNHQPGGVRAGVADGAFHVNGGVHQLFDFRVAVVGGLEIRHLVERFGKRHGFAGDIGDKFGNLVHFGDGNIHHARHIAQRTARGHRAEGDDLRHFVITIFLGGVNQHFGAAVIAEIQVNIGHGNAPGIEKALKKQVMRDGVYQRDEKRIGHQRSSAGAARVVPDAIFAGVTAQIPHDEKVGVKAHRVNDV